MSFDVNSSVDLAALKSEVETDPLVLGYNASSGDVANIISLISAKNYTVSRAKISSALIRSKTTLDAWSGLQAGEQGMLQWVAGSGGADEDDLEVTADLRLMLTGETGGGGNNSSIWPSAERSAMETAMLALIDVDGSRAEVIFGHGTVIRTQDWIAARDS